MALTSLVLSLALTQASGGPLEVNEQNFDKLREQIRAKGTDITWRDLPWQVDLLKVPQENAKKNSPLIMWLANGDPRSRTDTYGVMSRRMVWSDPMVISQARGFPLFLGDFNMVARKESWLNSTTRSDISRRGSGLYAIAPRGKFLGYTASTNASDVSKWLNEMQTAWGSLAGVERQWSEELAAVAKLLPANQPPKQTTPGTKVRRANGTEMVEVRAGGPIAEDEARPPQGRPDRTTSPSTTGTVAPNNNINAPAKLTDMNLRVTMRDMPRSGPFIWSDLYNMDSFMLTAARQEQILPPTLRATDVINWPTDLVRDLTRSVLGDNVRGHSLSYEDSQITVARMTTRVHSSYGTTVLLRFYGNIVAGAEGNWALAPGEAPKMDELQRRGVDLSAYGRAVYDTKLKKFMQFDMVFLGKRHGGSPLNLRKEDLNPQPLGIVITTAGQSWFDDVRQSATPR